MKDDLISRQNAIDAHCELCGDRGRCNCDICPDMEVFQLLPSAQTETYKEKLNEIASALSEKFAYMNTCLNERDIILGYLGVKRPNVCHCNTDCNNYRCESYHYDAKKYLELSDDTISRRAAIAVADYTDYTGLAIEDVKRVTDEVVKGLKQLPSAQPEIVRCKDCRWHETDINQCGRQVCAVMYDDDFCSLAERKEGTGK